MSDAAPTTVRPPAAEPVRLSAYPRARRSIRRVRAWTGLVVLGVVALLSLRAGLPAFDAVARALVAAIAAHFLAWGVAVAVWRQITLAELEAAREAHEARIAARRMQHAAAQRGSSG